MKKAKEAALTSYAPDPAEWFAEITRLFVTNSALLYFVRNRTWKILREQWRPVSNSDWQQELGKGVPDRIIRALHNKMQRNLPPYPQ